MLCSFLSENSHSGPPHGIDLTPILFSFKKNTSCKMKYVTYNCTIESLILWQLLSQAAQPFLAGSKAVRDLGSKNTANEEGSGYSLCGQGCAGLSFRGHSGRSATVCPQRVAWNGIYFCLELQWHWFVAMLLILYSPYAIMYVLHRDSAYICLYCLPTYIGCLTLHSSDNAGISVTRL